ncbi:MAG TPA: metallophosphoesterase [Flavisolibacter sp.]|nr:metallophosphoesterase [Flavisolibacter sp.]
MKHYIFFTLLFPVVMFMYGCASSHTGQSGKSFEFIQMSDTQFGMYTNNQDFAKETQHFEKAIQVANRLHPAFVIVCGDLVNRTGDTAQIAEYKRIAAGLDPSIHLYNVAGNHDVGNKPTLASLAAYRKNIGPDYYTFQYDNLFGIVLNSSLFFDGSLAPEEAAKQDAWLRATLEKTRKLKNKNIIVFEHIPWFINEPNEKDDYFNIPAAKRKDYVDLLKKYGVKYVFAGHLHKNAIGDGGDLTIVTTGPVGKPLGKDSSGFRVVTLKGNEIHYPYYRLDSLESQVVVR